MASIRIRPSTSYKAKKERKAQQHGLGINEFVDMFSKSTQLARDMFADLRFQVDEDGDYVFENAVLIVSRDVVGFGEVADIADVHTVVHKSFKTMHQFPTFRGLTVTAVAQRFFAHEEDIVDSLAVMSATFALAEMGLANPEMIQLSGKHFENVAEKLGLRKLAS